MKPWWIDYVDQVFRFALAFAFLAFCVYQCTT